MSGLWFQIYLVKKRGLEKFSNADFEALTDLVNDPQLDGIIGAVNDVVESSLGNTAFYKELILRHSAFLQ